MKQTVGKNKLAGTQQRKIMALYLGEEEFWKCAKHPSKRRRTGICPICLRDRLTTLCPDCANVRPCSCCVTTSSSSSSSSSFSRFNVAGVGKVGPVNNLIKSEPSLPRSGSMAISFLRSWSRLSGSDRDFDQDSPSLKRSSSTRSFWSIFMPQKSNRSGVQNQESNKKVLAEENVGDVSRRAIMTRSRSVAVAVAAVSGSGAGESKRRAKGTGCFFPSPMKAVRQSKVTKKVVQERSPLHRG